jgi:hypothetical protein
VYLALENIVGKTSVRRRQRLSFGFGLVLGFSYSFALTNTLQFAGAHKLDSVLSFNMGVEMAQLLALAVVVLALEILFRRVVAEGKGTLVVSGLVLLTAWRSMLDRIAQLRQYQFLWPALTASAEAAAMRGLILIIILACLAWLLFGVLGAWVKRATGGAAARVPQPRP